MKPLWRRLLLPAFWTLLASNAAVYAAWTLPRTAQHRSVAARAVTVREELARERQRVSALQERAATMTGNEADVQRFFTRLGGKPAVLAALDDVARTARESGVRLGARQYAPKAVKGAPQLARFEVNMPAEGSYRQIAAFLDRLERLPHLLVVERVSLRSGSDPAARAGELDIRMAMYFRAEEGDLAAE